MPGVSQGVGVAVPLAAGARRRSGIVGVAALAAALVLVPLAGTTADADAAPLAHAPAAAAPLDLATGGGPSQVVTSQLLVRWHDDVGRAARDAALEAAAPGAAGASSPLSERIDAVPLDGDALGAAQRRLQRSPLVEVVDVDRVLVAHRTTLATPLPTDPLFGFQWGLRNTGQTVGPKDAELPGVAGVDVNALAGWRVTRGDPSIVVAVIDTAVDPEHPDLAGALVGQVVTGGGTSGDRSHGTGVAAIIAGRADDAIGVAGVAPGVSILSIAAFGAASEDGLVVGTLASVIQAFEVAAAAGVDVVNASWETTDSSPLLRAVIGDVGVPVVAATGNRGLLLGPTIVAYPASYDLPNVIGVTAIGPRGEVPPFANIGRGAVDVAAPGVAVLTALAKGGHGWVDGTSAAAPFVAGGLALARSAAPYASTTDLIDAVLWSSRAQASLAGITASGGILDVGALVHAVQRPLCRPDRLPPSGFTDVPRTSVHASGIDCVSVNGVTRGRGDGAYDPTGTVTRGQMASFLRNLLGPRLDDTGAAPAGFVDVAPGHPHAASIDLLAAAGIVRGGDDGRFRPDEPVTRAQIASFLVRAHEHATATSASPSRRWYDDTTRSTHVAAIDRARDLGLVRGVTSVRFDPATAVRRDQMGSLLAHALDALARFEEEPR